MSESTNIRGKEWIFNAFWAASISQSVSTAKCSLNIPITALFVNGLPSKVLATDLSTGLIEKISLDDESYRHFFSKTDNSIVDEERNSGFRGSSLKLLKALRHLLVGFSKENGYDTYQSETDFFICKVLVLMVSYYQINIIKTFLVGYLY